MVLLASAETVGLRKAEADGSTDGDAMICVSCVEARLPDSSDNEAFKDLGIALQELQLDVRRFYFFLVQRRLGTELKWSIAESPAGWGGAGGARRVRTSCVQGTCLPCPRTAPSHAPRAYPGF